jgi:FMN phosphatase YigB (HAD superfamily)
MELPADRVAFVGHDAEELAGAAALGMPTIAFNYDPDAQADVFIASFQQLLPLVSTPSPQVGRG